MCAVMAGFAGEGATEKPTMSKKSYVYKTVENPPPYAGTTEIRADVIAPMDGKQHPVVVYLHGGGLINGSRANIQFGLDTFCQQEGYIYISADYRLGPETKVAGIVEDVRDLLRWVREEGPALFGADPERVAMTGVSAGAYLALAAATEPPRPKALVSAWGYADLLADWYTKPWPLFADQSVDRDTAYGEVYKEVLTETSGSSGHPARKAIYVYLRREGLSTKELTGFDPETQREKILPLCPRFNVTPDYPPTLLVHRERDDQVPVSESINMAAALKAKGVAHELKLFPTGKHSLNNSTPEQLAAEGACMHSFLRRHLGAGS